MATCEGSDDENCAEFIQEQLQTNTFRIYINDDVAGCEIAAALKNPLALSCGINYVDLP